MGYVIALHAFLAKLTPENRLESHVTSGYVELPGHGSTAAWNLRSLRPGTSLSKRLSMAHGYQSYG